MKSLTFVDILKIADEWLSLGGNPNLEIGALEPLLWRDGSYRINDVVKELVDRGYKVSMTTNGQYLGDYAKKLSKAGLALIRTSWHSTDPLIFKEISGGYGDYEKFISGVTEALDLGMKIDFNRVLLQGFTSDIPNQLSFIESYNSRLKLFTLLWTPQGDSSHESQYQDWRPIVKQHVLPKTRKIERVSKQLGRKRLKFHLNGGGSVEVKLGDRLDRTSAPCNTCELQAKCEESFGDYARIDPNLNLYFCYLRRDIGFYLPDFFGKHEELSIKIQDELRDVDLSNLLLDTSLRLTVTPNCNFNCRAPGEEKGWCMEEPGEYKYPPIKKTLVQIK